MSKTTTGCACTQELKDRLRAYPVKKDSLRKVTCMDCGQLFGTNAAIERCFDCEAKTRQGSTEVTGK